MTTFKMFAEKHGVNVETIYRRWRKGLLKAKIGAIGGRPVWVVHPENQAFERHKRGPKVKARK